MTPFQLDAPTLFPPPSPTGLPEFSSLLLTGPYHPSAPLYLALSLSNTHRPVVFHPSKTEFVASLKRFNDAWLLSRAGHGSMAEITSNIEIFYPPSPAHLCILLSMFCAERPDILANVTYPPTSRPRRVWDVIILLEPSQYFIAMSDDSSPNNLNLSSYLTLVQRSLAYISTLASKTKGPPPKIILFDSRLHDLVLPMTKVPFDFPEAGEADRFHQIHALSLVETYFQIVGVFGEDQSFVPSSQGDEVTQDGDPQKQLRLYYVDTPSSDFVLCRWWEVSASDSDGTLFKWA